MSILLFPLLFLLPFIFVFFKALDDDDDEKESIVVAVGNDIIVFQLLLCSFSE